MRLFVLFALLFPLVTSAQVLQLDAGGGTLLTGGTPGGGAGATLYIPNQNLYFSGNYYQNHLIFGASDEFMFRNADVTVGSKMLGFASGGVGIGLSIFGFTTRYKRELQCSDQSMPITSRWPGYAGRHCSGGWELTAFIGATGQGYLMPYAFGTKQQHVGTGILFQRKFQSGIYLSSMEVLNGGQYTSAQGVGYRYPQKLDVSISGGVITNQKYFNGIGFYQPFEFLSINANHQSYFSPYHVQGNGIGAGLSIKSFNFQASVNNSKSFGLKVFGESLGLGVHVGWLGAQSSWYQSAGRTFLNHSAMETFRRWSATEGVTQSDHGQSSFTGSLTYHTNRASISVNHGIQFLLNGRGYQSVTSGSISFRISSLVVNAQAVVDPFGRMLWSGWTESYTQTGLHFPEGHGFVARGSNGKYLISGKCLEDGQPLAGCAVIFSSGDTVYSNSCGEFELHLKKNHPVSVVADPEQFIAPGLFEVVSAPATATPGDEIVIVVRHK